MTGVQTCALPILGDSHHFGLGLEVVNRAAVDVDRDLPFQLGGIGIFSWVQILNIVFFSHVAASQFSDIDLLLTFSRLSC